MLNAKTKLCDANYCTTSSWIPDCSDRSPKQLLSNTNRFRRFLLLLCVDFCFSLTHVSREIVCSAIISTMLLLLLLSSSEMLSHRVPGTPGSKSTFLFLLVSPVSII